MANNLMNKTFESDLLPFDFFDNFGKNFFKSMSPAVTFKTDVVEHEKDYLLKAELPGFKKEALHIDYQNDVLTISGKREHSKEEKDEAGNVLSSERSFGSVSRQFYLPGSDQGEIKAVYDGGILKVTLPKVESENSHSPIKID